jgi:5'-methylthioadenosine phosphorylase
MADAEIGVFGGSGFYSLLKDAEEVEVETPYGNPSDRAAIGKVGNRKVAFIPRHGKNHSIPPHKINYRANLWAMRELGVKRIIAPAAVGSLQPHVRPGDFVVCDQFVDRTTGRLDTYCEGKPVTHISCAEPYCPEMAKVAVETGKKLGVTVHPAGTVVVIQGPRFSSKAESRWFRNQEWEVINMTQYPEVVLARELEICYCNISLVTDYDVGLEGVPGIKPTTAAEVGAVFQKNNERVKQLVLDMVPKLPAERKCPCATALKGATI